MPVLFCHWAPRSGGTRCVGNLLWRLGTGSAGWIASSLASTLVSVIIGAGSCGQGHGMRRSVSVTPQLNPLVVLQSWWRGSLLALGEASTFAHSEYIPLLVGRACRLRQVPHYASMSLSTCFPGLVLREQEGSVAVRLVIASRPPQPSALAPERLDFPKPGLRAPRAKLPGLRAQPATGLPAADLSIPHGVQPACSTAAYSLGCVPVEPPEFSSLDLE